MYETVTPDSAPAFSDWGPLTKKTVHGMGQHFFREYELRTTDIIKTQVHF